MTKNKTDAPESASDNVYFGDYDCIESAIGDEIVIAITGQMRPIDAQKKALDELTELSQEMGLYDMVYKHD